MIDSPHCFRQPGKKHNNFAQQEEFVPGPNVFQQIENVLTQSVFWLFCAVHVSAPPYTGILADQEIKWCAPARTVIAGAQAVKLAIEFPLQTRLLRSGGLQRRHISR